MFKLNRIQINKSRSNHNGPSFNGTHLVAKYSLKFNNTIITCLIRLNIILCYFLPLNIFEWLFNMSDLSIELQSTEKCLFPFKDTS